MSEAGVINENLRHALAAFSHIDASGDVSQGPHISLCYAGVPYGLFNTALLTAPLPDPDHDFPILLNRAREFFTGHNAPWSLWLCEDFLPAEARRRCRVTLATAGLKIMVDTPGMIAPRLEGSGAVLPKLSCRPVGDYRTRTDFSGIMSRAFQVPEEMARKVYAGARLWTGPMLGWIGYIDEEPVCTTCIVSSPGAIGLYAVATPPKHQRRGYAEAIIRHAVDEAFRTAGPLPVVLQSSAAGHALYRRMGFRDVTRFVVFVS